jgi:hypothetical protein
MNLLLSVKRLLENIVMKAKLRFFLLVVLLSFTTNAFADPDPNFHIFLCFGQSNMEGFPGIEEQDKAAVDSRFQVLATVDFPRAGRTKGHWYDAVPPLCRLQQHHGGTAEDTSQFLCHFFGRLHLPSRPHALQFGRFQGVRKTICQEDAFVAGV